MKTFLHLSTAMMLLTGSLFSQSLFLQVQPATYNPQNNFVSAQPSNPNAALNNVGDTLRYFLLKHYYRNPSSGSPTPNTQYYTLSNPYPGNTYTINYCGSVFLNTSSITVTGLEGIVTRRSNAVSANVPIKLYICNVNGANLPIFPPLDSISTTASAATNGSWIGGNFNTPLAISGKFAVLYKNTSTVAGDTLGMFINNACTPTSTCPAYQKFGESLGVFRINGNFQTTTNAFGTGTDYEFIVAPRVLFNYSGGVSVLTQSICTNSTGSFNNTTVPMNLVEHRQFNFNKFASVWGALSNTLLPTTDSIYNWTFSGSSTPPLTTKNAVAVFTLAGIQTASLTVKYNKSRAGGLLPSVFDVATNTIDVSSANTPTLSISGNSLICSGSSTTLTATGSATNTWAGMPFNSPVLVASPSVTSVYTVSANNSICVAYYTYTVQVANPPTVAVTGPTAACLGSSVLLTASGASSYSWSNGSTTYSTSISPSSTGVQTYTVLGTSAPCPPSLATKTIAVYALPSVSLASPAATICSMGSGGHTLQLVGSPVGGVYSGSFVSGSGVFTPFNAATVTITYSYTDPASGCMNTSTTSIRVLNCSGVGLTENSGTAMPVIYPNPCTTGKLNINNLQGSNTLLVYDILGKEVLRQTVESPDAVLDLSAFAKGTYLMKISDTNGQNSLHRIVLMKE
ncbi:MAG TPA: T9SS type A sorting domain-containing protein [Bacteroidia bacterium]|nr:T9SS type A sorting domain-containing protein [Bacteroidia bacterium]